MRGIRRVAIERTCLSCSAQFFQSSSGRAQTLCKVCGQKLLRPSSRPATYTPVTAHPHQHWDLGEIEDLRKRLRWGGYVALARIPLLADFLQALRLECAASLFMFTKFVLGMNDLTEHLHHPVCDWLQDMAVSRRKLLMLPVVHLKTTIGSHAFPLHALIQPAATNLYFKGMAGADLRILLHGETTPKAMENLSMIRQHMQSNQVLRKLWPKVFWDDPKRESPNWTDNMVTVRRSRIFAEPSITAIGVGTGLEQRHYDIIIVDDIATFDAALSEITMNRAKMRRKALRSRLNDLTRSIELGIGTHWTANDVYVEWRKDPSVAVMIRAAIEHGVPIWPERYPLEALLALQAEEGMGRVLFSANYMNNPLNAAFSAMDWQEVRTYRIENNFVVFDKDTQDTTLAERMVAGGKFTSVYWTRKSEFTRGTPLDRLYPPGSRNDDETPEQRELRLLSRLERKAQHAAEGSADWVRLNELFARQREIAKERGLLN